MGIEGQNQVSKHSLGNLYRPNHLNRDQEPLDIPIGSHHGLQGKQRKLPDLDGHLGATHLEHQVAGPRNEGSNRFMLAAIPRIATAADHRSTGCGSKLGLRVVKAID